MQIVKGWGVEECPGDIIFVYNTDIYTFVGVSSLLLKKKCIRFLGRMYVNHVVWKHAFATFCYNWSSEFVIVITFHSFIHAHCAWTRTQAGMVMSTSHSYCSHEPRDWFWWSVKVLHECYDIRGHTKFILPDFQSGNGVDFSPSFPCPCCPTNALHNLVSLLYCWIKCLASPCS